jgi:hypothetical protein
MAAPPVPGWLGMYWPPFQQASHCSRTQQLQQLKHARCYTVAEPAATAPSLSQWLCTTFEMGAAGHPKGRLRPIGQILTTMHLWVMHVHTCIQLGLKQCLLAS